MKISVIVCTYNRCTSLASALDSIAASIVPSSTEWEVLVIDNSSTDRTREVTEDFCTRNPGRFRYLLEPQRGKSHALNTGIREAKGDILAFTDDDVIVEPTWLHNLTAVLDNEEWVGSGGRTLPEQNFLPPRWLLLETKHATGPLAVFDLGPVATMLSEPPFGNNVAFHKRMFERYGTFRTDFGPPPGNKIRGEDTEFGRRLLTAGERLYYEPSAVVYHSVPTSRIRKEYFLEWWYDKARTDIQEFGPPSESKWQLNGIPLILFRRLTVWTLKWIFGLSPAKRFSCKLNVWSSAGKIMECHNEFRKSTRRLPIVPG
jgi:glucosyl-dolichyl phosphate glucuronosyltransferase